MKTIETWKTVKDFNNYEVSTFGRIRNKLTGKFRKPVILKGYLRLILNNDDGTKKTYRVHRLVAEAFIPNFDPSCDVDHIDRDRSNNYLTNLRCVSKIVNQGNRSKTSRGTLIDFIKIISLKNSLEKVEDIIQYLENNELKIKFRIIN